jgi:hypothetical protein
MKYRRMVAAAAAGAGAAAILVATPEAPPATPVTKTPTFTG